MKGHTMKKLVLMAILMSGCGTISPIESKVISLLAADAKRTEELANKYQSPEVAQCMVWLQQALVGVEELANEATNGIISTAFKTALLRRLQSISEEQFTAECGALAARMLVELGRSFPGR